MKIIRKYYEIIIFLSFVIWCVGLSYLINGGDMIYAIFIPIGTVCFYFALSVRLFTSKDVESNADQETTDNSRLTWVDHSTNLANILGLRYVLVFWLCFIGVFFSMPFSNIYTYQKIVEQIEWNETKIQLDISPELDSSFGTRRRYSYPNWITKEDEIKIAKVHTGGEDAYGSFIYAISKEGNVLYLDSIVTDTD